MIHPLLSRFLRLSITAALLTSVAKAGNSDPILRIGRALTPAEAQVELDQLSNSYSDLAGWEDRR